MISSFYFYGKFSSNNSPLLSMQCTENKYPLKNPLINSTNTSELYKLCSNKVYCKISRRKKSIWCSNQILMRKIIE